MRIDDFYPRGELILNKITSSNVKNYLQKVYMKYYLGKDILFSERGMSYLVKTVDRIYQKYFSDVDNSNLFLITREQLKNFKYKIVFPQIEMESPYEYRIDGNSFRMNRESLNRITIFQLIKKMFEYNQVRKVEIDDTIPCSSTILVQDNRTGDYHIIGGIYLNFPIDEIDVVFGEYDDNVKNEVREKVKKYYPEHTSSVHSELHTVMKVKDRIKEIFSNDGCLRFDKISMVIVRNGEFIPSRPCKGCRTVIKEFFKEVIEHSMNVNSSSKCDENLSFSLLYPFGDEYLVVEELKKDWKEKEEKGDDF